MANKKENACRPHQLESRTLENCLSGSEGGGAFALPTPIFTPSRGCRGFAEIAPGCPREIARHSGKHPLFGQQVVLGASNQKVKIRDSVNFELVGKFVCGSQP